MVPEEWLRRFAGIVGAGETPAITCASRCRRRRCSTRCSRRSPRSRRRAFRSRATSCVASTASRRSTRRRRSSASCATTSARARLVRSSCGASASAAAWPTTWASARRSGARAARSPARDDAKRRRPSLVVVPRSLVFNWSRRPRASRRSCACSTTRASAGRVRDTFDEHRPGPHDLRHAAARCADVAGRRVRLRHPRRGAGDQERDDRGRRRRRGCSAREHRLALTGTPVENHLGELWSLFEFLNPGMLGRRRRRSRATARRGDGGSGGARACWPAALRPFILRRTKEQVATDLPAKHRTDDLLRARGARSASSTTSCATTTAPRCSAAIEREGIAEVEDAVLEALLRLRQAACHPGLVDQAARRRAVRQARRAAAAAARGRATRGTRSLVFSQFTSLLAIVRDAARREARSSTSTSTARRATARRASSDSRPTGRAGCS